MVDQVNNGEQTFLDANGDPLSGGLVFFYIVNTSSYAPTWQDSAGTIVNPQPIVLDQAGRALIWGVGQYRQVVQDQFGNVQWDRVTETSGSTGNMSGSVTGDLQVTGNGRVNGDLNVGGNFTANNEVVGGTATFNNATVNGTLTVNSIENAAAVNTGSLTASNVTVSGQANLNNVLAAGTIEADGNRIIVKGGSSPSFTMLNTTNNLGIGMWNASGFLQFGTLDAAGNPVASLVLIDTAGDLVLETANLVSRGTIAAQGGASTFAGGVFPVTNGGSDCGNSGSAWGTVAGHNIVGPFSAFQGFMTAVGAPVEALNTFEAAADPMAVMGVVQDESVNLGAMTVLLWQCLKELNQKFNDYVAAHP